MEIGLISGAWILVDLVVVMTVVVSVVFVQAFNRHFDALFEFSATYFEREVKIY